MPRVLLVAAAALCAHAEHSVNISNVEARLDVDGQIMDVHDGNVAQWEEGGLYYWYGMGYKDCDVTKTGLIPPKNCPGIYLPFGECGFRTDHAVNIYSSPDLASWTFVGEALPEVNQKTGEARPEGIYFRPKMVFNKKTGEYVLWVNHLPKAITPLVAYPSARYIVATSTSPTGPFSVVTEAAATAVSGAGDFSLFVDTDGAAYLAYDAWGNNHQITIERLTDDYHDTLGAAATTGPLTPNSNEAAALFERDGTYYLTYGNTCCFCHTGSNAHVQTASHPMGPWTDAGYDIDGSAKSAIRPYNSTAGAQQNAVFRFISGGSVAYMWTGDRWGSAPDGLKSHDVQFWQPLKFDDSVSPPAIAPLRWADSFSLTMPDSVATVV